MGNAKERKSDRRERLMGRASDGAKEKERERRGDWEKEEGLKA